MPSIYQHRLKSIWNGIIHRCYNEKSDFYQDYGNRGIKVCKRWLKYKNFYNDLIDTHDPKLTLDRVKNNKGYRLSNVRWATKREQALNRRSNNIITCRGITAPFIIFSDLSGNKPTTIYNRIARGWDLEKAIFTPSRYRKKIVKG